MKKNSSLVHDTERAPESWLASVDDNSDRPVIERAYRAVIVLLLSSGLRGLSDVKTADIARLCHINESTLFRYVKKRDQLVADAVDWCWGKVNRRIAETHHRQPPIDMSASELIMTDLLAFLDQFDDDEGKLVGTGAMLSFRRAEQLTDGFECPNQLEFRNRLGLLASALVKGCDTGGHDPEVIATYLTNYLATVWFTWLADPSSRDGSGFLNRDMVRRHIESTLATYATCAFPMPDAAAG